MDAAGPSGLSTNENIENNESNLNITIINQEIHNYVEELHNFVVDHIEVTTSNAIELNVKFREVLLKLRGELEELRAKCVKKYEENEFKLIDIQENHIKKKRTRAYSFYSCGAPYFKNSKFYAALPNEEYQKLENVKKYHFPLDLQLLNNGINWTSKDKTTLIFSIKQQIFEYILQMKDYSKSQKVVLKKLTLAELYELVEDEQFSINWTRISYRQLDERHSETECMGMWYEYLHPNLRRSPWTLQEDRQLMSASKQHNFQNWKEIAKQVKNRSALQCFLRYQTTFCTTAQITKNTKWTEAEDKLLQETVEKYRQGALIPWTKVTENMPNRNKIQVYHRYVNTLKPGIKREAFTKEEDCILIAAIQEYGTNYTAIPSDILPGRTQVQIRNRYNNVLKYAGKARQWTLEDDEKLINFVKVHGTSKWSEIAAILKCHTRVSCRTRYLTISKFLTKDPSMQMKDIPRKNRIKNHVNADNWLETLVNLKETKEEESAEKLSAKNTTPSNKETTVYDPNFFYKLSSTKRDYYNYFKYSYDFNYYGRNTNRQNDERVTNMNMCLMSHLVNTKLELNWIEQNGKEFGQFEIDVRRADFDKLKVHFRSMFPEDASFYIPPNWNTLLLARAFEIMISSSKLDKLNRTKPQKTVFDENHSAFRLFKNRLKLLLFYPIVLSKLSPVLQAESLSIKQDPSSSDRKRVSVAEVDKTNIKKQRKDE